MGFKSNDKFVRYATIGAEAANAVRADLKLHGHEAMELERFAMSNKVWQTKAKRMRLPDLLCVKCGLRVESRGKTASGSSFRTPRATTADGKGECAKGTCSPSSTST